MAPSFHNQSGGSGVRPRGNSNHGGRGGRGGGYGGGHGGGGRGYPPQRPNEKVSDQWESYLAEGYFDEQGNLRPELVSREKVEPLVERMANASYPDTGLTTHQIRRFFGHCRMIDTKLRAAAQSWSELRTTFQVLDIAATDAYGKDKPKIPSLFYDFIKRNVAAVKSEKDFRDGFIPHFEALVGFGSPHFKKERN